jgi:osmoprotectant transport system permease protein
MARSDGIIHRHSRESGNPGASDEWSPWVPAFAGTTRIEREGIIAPPRLHNRVLLVLTIIGLAAGVGLAFLTQAPNRLIGGRPIALGAIVDGVGMVALLPGLVLLAGPLLPPRRGAHYVVAVAAAAFLVALPWLAGAQAAALAEVAPRAARTSLGGGFWGLFICAALALVDAEHRLRLGPGARFLAGAAVVAAILLLAASGALDQLAIMKEYAARRGVFAGAVIRHVAIVLGALLPTVLVGAPLGLMAQRRKRLRAALFPALNLVQTIPSIALFGLLIAPLSALAGLAPGLAALGVSGVGVTPAIIALVLYSLLPVVRNTTSGLDAVPAAAIEAARGIGMTRRQILVAVEIPLALPVFLSGLRIATVQAVGLVAVAALIGAGGLGAIMFQGLFADALDLVLLGAVPIILLALAADALLGLASGLGRRRPA